MAKSVIDVEMLPVTKQEITGRRYSGISEQKRSTDHHHSCQSDTEDLVRMLKEALDLSDVDAKPKPRANSRPLSGCSSVSSTSSSRVPSRRSSSTDAAVRRIEKENARLLQRITEKAGKRQMTGTLSYRAADRRVQTASTVNRKRENDRISRENAAMLQRIQSVKPSRAVTMEIHRKHFAAHQRYSQNASCLHGYRSQTTPRRPSSAKETAISGGEKQVQTNYTWEAGW